MNGASVTIVVFFGILVVCVTLVVAYCFFKPKPAKFAHAEAVAVVGEPAVASNGYTSGYTGSNSGGGKSRYAEGQQMVYLSADTEL